MRSADSMVSIVEDWENGHVSDDAEERFRAFVAYAEPRLRRALVAAYGAERGREAVAEALAFAWEEWSRVAAMTNPTGYLFRVGQSRTRARKRPVVFPDATMTEAPWVEPGLVDAMRAMTERQRIAVVLVHGYQWSVREVAELTGLTRSTVQKHLDRGIGKLRAALGVDTDA